MGHPGQNMRPVDGPAEPASLVFRAGSLRCALRLDEVIETMRPLPTRPLAGTPPFVLGISVLRGVPTPVIDVARLLDGGDAEVSRFIAVRTERGPTAFAIGDVLGIRSNVGDTGAQHPAVLASAPNRLVAGIGTVDAEPLLLLQSMRVVSDDVWAAAAAAGMPS